MKSNDTPATSTPTPANGRKDGAKEQASKTASAQRGPGQSLSAFGFIRRPLVLASERHRTSHCVVRH